MPAVLVEKQRGALTVAACNALARIHGLRAGQSLTEARILFPALHVGEIDRAADHAALMRLAAVCERFTPLIALDGMDGLLLDVTGCAHLFGGEGMLQRAISEFMVSRSFTVHQAVASSFDCAHVLARFGRVTNVPAGEELDAVSDLPVAALECEASITTALVRAGLRTIGDLASRPSQLLVARFGSGLTTRLARVLRKEDMRLTPLRPAPAFVADASFAEPIGLMDQVMLVLSRLITQLCADMEEHGQGGRQFEVCFFRVDGVTRRLTIATSGPMRDATGLAKLFALRLDTLNNPLEPGFGFDAMRLNVLSSEALHHHQSHFTEKQEAQQSEADLINRLNIRFSTSRVLGFVARDSHDPMRAAAVVPIAVAKSDASWRAADDPLPRPLQLFSTPQPIDVMAEVPDGPPIRFRWRKVLHSICAAEGPERIEGEWWRGARPVRDYYRVEDDKGSRYWVFREGLFTDSTPRWFLHGLFP